MASKSVPPSIRESAFSCPYCGAFTSQKWYECATVDIPTKTPSINWGEKCDLTWLDALDLSPMDREQFERLKQDLLGGQIIFEEFRTEHDHLHDGISATYIALNVFLSSCFHCEKVALWIHDKLVYPPERQGSPPNPDLPEEIQRDYEEARSILNLSPRGAAALLRLCIQKLCRHLKEKGERIDDDIANLVKKGLNPTVQKALDVVRVVGNEAVHPGELDLRDDPDTAANLLALINLIADQMITNPKEVDRMYEKLPEKKQKAIEARNHKAIGK